MAGALPLPLGNVGAAGRKSPTGGGSSHEIGPLPLPRADLQFQGPADGVPLRRRERLTHLILDVLARKDRRHIEDPAGDLRPMKDALAREEAPLAEDQLEVPRDPNGLEESFLANTLGERLHVAQIAAVRAANLDLANRYVADFHIPPPAHHP